MTPLTLSQARTKILWRALCSELDRLENHENNARYRSGREEILSEMREIRETLREINASANILDDADFKNMLSDYTFASSWVPDPAEKAA